jgi:hypothetical protein
MAHRFWRFVFPFLLPVVLLLLLRKTEAFNSLKNVFAQKEIKVDETPLLVTQIKSIAQLLTIEALNEVVVDSTRSPFGLLPEVLKNLPTTPLRFLGASQLVLIVRGTVRAGVNLEQIDERSIRIIGDSLFVALPPAIVFDIITNPFDVETFIEKGEWNPAAATALQAKARQQLVQQALAQGLLQQANNNARQLIYGLLKNTGYAYIQVTTAPQVHPSSGK